MHIRTITRWQHAHQFTSHDARNERNTTWVVVLTVAMMVMEIGAGMLFGSMALLLTAGIWEPMPPRWGLRW